MQALSLLYPQNYGSVCNRTVYRNAKDIVNVFVIRSVFYVQFPRLKLKVVFIILINDQTILTSTLAAGIVRDAFA